MGVNEKSQVIFHIEINGIFQSDNFQVLGILVIGAVDCIKQVQQLSGFLKEHPEESIRQVVDKIIDGQIADGLLKSAPLTFRDVETIKSVFVDKLKTMFHTRISYPDLKK